mmetsp:Transcript_10017/g.22056  ORF Transcript_10017/g.22056 Transcript_10017/m.22056 type:complete len:599 (-) Transcript_10017:135-1931(-)
MVGHSHQLAGLLSQWHSPFSSSDDVLSASLPVVRRREVSSFAGADGNVGQPGGGQGGAGGGPGGGGEGTALSVDEQASATQVEEGDPSKEVYSPEEAEQQLDEQIKYLMAMKEFAIAKTDLASRLVASNRQLQADTDMSKAMEGAAELLKLMGPTLKRCNSHLDRLREHRHLLSELRKLGPVAEPRLEQQALNYIRMDARSIHNDLHKSLKILHQVNTFTNVAEQQAKATKPFLREDQVRFLPPKEEEEEEADEAAIEEEEEPKELGDPLQTEGHELVRSLSVGEPVTEENNTSAGCTCDKYAQCSLQGRDFTWCRVGGNNCSLLRFDKVHSNDPGGLDHNLYKASEEYPATTPSRERSGAVWDYCVAKPALKGENSAPRTAHGGVCAWRGDLYKRYAEDPQYQGPHKKLLLNKIPIRDRQAVQVMDQLAQHPDQHGLCDRTAGSRGYAICPAVPDPEQPESASVGWFAGRTWDFCSDADRGYRPTRATGTIEEGNPDTIPSGLPKAPEMPEPKEEEEEVITEEDVAEEDIPAEGQGAEMEAETEQQVMEQAMPNLFAAVAMPLLSSLGPARAKACRRESRRCSFEDFLSTPGISLVA